MADSHPLAVSRDDKRRTLSRHLVAVVEELAEAGTAYGDLSVERIIKAGGISRSAFYNYFDDKADLLVAMAEDVIQDLIDTGDAWWGLESTAGKAGLRQALGAPLGNYRAHQRILGAIVEVATYDERVREKQQWLIGAVIAALTSHVEEGQRAGTISPELDPLRTAKWLVWMLERGLYQEVTPVGEDEAERLMDAITDVVWRVLYDGFREA